MRGAGQLSVSGRQDGHTSLQNQQGHEKRVQDLTDLLISPGGPNREDLAVAHDCWSVAFFLERDLHTSARFLMVSRGDDDGKNGSWPSFWHLQGSCVDMPRAHARDLVAVLKCVSGAKGRSERMQNWHQPAVHRRGTEVGWGRSDSPKLEVGESAE